MRFSPRERKFAAMILERALFEDKADKDVTSLVACSEKCSRFALRARQDLTVSGLEVLELGFPKAEIVFLCEDGDKVSKGAVLARIEGPLRSILSAERSVLDLLQRMCSVATCTAQYAAIAGGGVKIVDTRKTMPGFRLLDKYAVRCGGGVNHRLDLSDMIMFKDNHLAYSGLTYKELFEKARKEYPGVPIAVEAENYEQALELAKLGPDILMLDNMPPEEMKKVSEALAGRVTLEATGGVTLDNLKEIAASGVQRISIGAITHSAKCVDIGLDAEE